VSPAESETIIAFVCFTAALAEIFSAAMLWTGRCSHHTGNSTQGHYWAHCKVLAARLREELAPGETLSLAEHMRRTSREFHLCCDDPAFGCSLEAAQ
jgi:hypothetical protein